MPSGRSSPPAARSWVKRGGNEAAPGSVVPVSMGLVGVSAGPVRVRVSV